MSQGRAKPDTCPMWRGPLAYGHAGAARIGRLVADMPPSLGEDQQAMTPYGTTQPTQADQTGDLPATRGQAGAEQAKLLPRRMSPPMPGSAFWGWAGPLLVTLFGAFLRFNQLGTPKAVVFDETYYVPDSW